MLPANRSPLIPEIPPWHTSCPKTASMWKQGCIQLNRCPNSVHVPRHSPALCVSASSLPLCNSVNLTTNNKQLKTLPLAPATCNLLTNTYKIFHLPRRISRNFAKLRGKFFLCTATRNSHPGTPIIPMHSTILQMFASVFANVLQVTSPCKGTYCQKLQMFADVFLSAESQPGQLANVTTNMSLFCKCL
jgi:hypothetical protein